MADIILEDFAKRIQTGTGGGGLINTGMSVPVTTSQNTTTGPEEDLHSSILFNMKTYTVASSVLSGGETHESHSEVAVSPSQAVSPTYMTNLVFNVGDQIPDYGTPTDVENVVVTIASVEPSGYRAGIDSYTPTYLPDTENLEIEIYYWTISTEVKSVTFNVTYTLNYSYYRTTFTENYTMTTDRIRDEVISEDKSTVSSIEVTGTVDSRYNATTGNSTQVYEVEHYMSNDDFVITLTPVLYSQNQQAGTDTFYSVSVGLMGRTTTTSYIYTGTATIPSADRRENTISTISISSTNNNFVKMQIDSYDSSSGIVRFTVWSDVTLNQGVSGNVTITYRHRTPTYPIYRYYWAIEVNGQDLSSIASDSVIYINGTRYDAQSAYSRR